MGSNFWWIYDIVTVVIIIFSVYRCSKKGFSKIVVTALGCAVSLVAAFAVSRSCSGMIYDKFFKENNVKLVEAALKDYCPEDVIKSILEKNELSGILSNDKIKEILKDGDSLDRLYDYANQEAAREYISEKEFDKDLINGFAQSFAAQVGVSLPPYVAEELTSHISDNRELYLETINMLVNEPSKVPSYIEENYIRDIAKKAVSSAAFLVVFCVLMTIVFIISGKSVQFGLLNGYDRLDKFAGGVLGLIAAAAAVIMIAMAVKLMINMMDKENSFISLNTVEKTKFFRLFYKFL